MSIPSDRSWVICGEALETMRTFDDDSFDSLVTDPPAGIGFMGKAWDSAKGGRDKWIAWLAEIMAEALRVMKPGAHGLVWALPRTSHWTATALENAGFEIRDVVMHLFGNGYPKSHNLLKPAAEHWILVRKPFRGTVDANVRQHGTGSINVEGCRVGTSGGTKKGSFPKGKSVSAYGDGINGACDIVDLGVGRWPPHLVMTEGGVDCPAAEMNRGASRFFPRFRYQAKPSARERSAGLDDRNPHPTVKPIELMRWLERLITPPGGTVLDPFAGSGTTGCAAVLEGFDFVGIEQSLDFSHVARRRIQHWASNEQGA